jgi:glutaredoxin
LITILYSTNCPQCKVLKSKLDESNIEYEVCSDTNLMLSKGLKSVPMLEVSGRIMNLSESVKWINSINTTLQEGN